MTYRGYKLSDGIANCNLFPYKVIVNIYVFCSDMEGWIYRKRYDTKTVAKENQMFRVNRLQYLLKHMKPTSIQQVQMQVPNILLLHWIWQLLFAFSLSMIYSLIRGKYSSRW